MQQNDNIIRLLIKQLRQELTPEESASLEEWRKKSEKNQQFFEDLIDEKYLAEALRQYSEERNVDLRDAWEKMKRLGWERTQRARVVSAGRRWFIISAAAAILLVLIGSYFIRQFDKPQPAPVIVKDVKQDAKPKTQQAILTLDNGETIILDSLLKDGLLATQGNTQVTKDKDGVLRYKGGSGANQQLIYNKVTVPKGSDVVYLQLSDQTKVWLNAASSIRYPVAFAEDERKVEITGEAYFEVTRQGLPPTPSGGGGAKNKRFIVSKGDMHVVVMGTSFNVNTYENEENIRVTLLEGSVKVQMDNTERTIKPGQQAVLNNKTIDVLSEVDVHAVMAWKEGKFVFNNTNIQLIMRQMERWYDLEKTEFRNEAVKQLAFNGAISRYNNASKVLELLEEAGALHFTIQGKKVLLYQ